MPNHPYIVDSSTLRKITALLHQDGKVEFTGTNDRNESATITIFHACVGVTEMHVAYWTTSGMHEGETRHGNLEFCILELPTFLLPFIHFTSPE